MHEPDDPLLITGVLPRNVKFAQRLGAPGRIIMDRGHADGVRMRDHACFIEPDGERIALLLEAGQHWAGETLAHARNVLMRFLIASDCVDASDVPAGWLLPTAWASDVIEVTHAVIARSMDFTFTAEFTGGELLPRAGTLIAHDAGQTIRTPYDNCVLVMPSTRQLRPGVTMVRLGRRVEDLALRASA